MKTIVIVGPTGVGKTKLSIELAKKYDGEVINADSTQVYKYLDIATSKVTKEEMGIIPHHLFSFKELDESYTIYDYKKDCLNKIEEIKKRGKTPILVGGSGLYLNAVLYDYKLEEEKEVKINKDNLYEQVLKIDPNTTIHKNNKKRLERFLKHYLATGKIENQNDKELKLDAIIIGLTTERKVLYERINNRVYQMLDSGLEMEAKSLFDKKLFYPSVLTPIGYKELFLYFEGKIEKKDAIELIQKNTRHYAKRQYTWFLNKMDVTWFDVCFTDFNATILEIEKYIEKQI